MKRLAITAALLACAITTPAEAATLTNSGGLLTYITNGSEPVSLTFQYGRTGYVGVLPQSAYNRDPITSATGCTSVGVGYVYYECHDVTEVIATGGSGDDSFDAADLDVPLTVDGGPGDDQLIGGHRADSLMGGAGDDYLAGETGDTLSGGPGLDVATYTPPQDMLGPVSLTLDGVADDGVAGDRANFLADLEDIESDGRFESPDSPLPAYGPVTLVGTAAGNRLTGSSGPDTITGAGGIDVLEGMAGDDTLLARDGLADRVRCGEGTDTAIVDPFDQVSDTCESVLVAGNGPPADDAAPRISWRPGSALGILAEDDHGIASVRWLDDDRVICTDTTAPFDCDYRPRIEDVGSNTLIAIATDTAGQTASITVRRTVERFKPTAVALTVKRSGRRFVASGKVSLPTTIPCSGAVTVAKRTGKLRSNCTFRIVVPRSTKYTAEYLGTDAIASKRSKAVRPRT